jgi:hypothetical protein
LARKISRKNNENFIEYSTKYFNLKVKPFDIMEDDWVVMKEQIFLHKNRKLAETFESPFRITKAHT